MKWSARLPGWLTGSVQVVPTPKGARILAVSGQPGSVHCLDGRGRKVWSYEAGGSIRFDGNAGVGDIDGDGRVEVLLVPRQGILYCLDLMTGAVRWQRPLAGCIDNLGGGQAYGGPVLADLPGGKGTQALWGSDMGALYCANGDGSIRWAWKAGGSIYAAVAVAPVRIGGERVERVFVPSKDGHFYALDTNGRVLWRVKTGCENSAAPAVGELNGGDAAVFGAKDGHVRCVDAATGDMRWDFASDSTVDSSLAIADLALGDGRKERSVLFCSIRKFYCLNPDGSQRWSFESPEGGEMESDNGPAIADIDNDGMSEIVFGSKNGSLYCLSADGKLEWRRDHGPVRLQISPAIADVDGDGKLEIVYGHSGGDVYCLATPAPVAAPVVMPGADAAHTGAFDHPSPAPVQKNAGRLAMRAAGGSRIDGRIEVRGGSAGDKNYYVTFMTRLGGDDPAEMKPLEVFVCAQDPLAVLRGRLNVSLNEAGKAVWKRSFAVESANDAAVVPISPDGLAQGERQTLAARYEPEGGQAVECKVEFTVMRRPPLRRQAASVGRRLARLDEFAKALPADHQAHQTLQLMKMCYDFAVEDIEGTSLRRARENLDDLSRAIPQAQAELGAPLAAAQPAPKPRVKLRKDGVLLLDGKPTFPLGLYNATTAKDLRDIARDGFNIVFNTGDEAFWKAADELGVMCVAGGPGEHLQIYSALARLRPHFEKTMRYPTLVGWYIVDEPSLRNIEPKVIDRVGALVKAIAPLHYGLVCDGAPFKAAPYLAGADIPLPAFYPIWKGMPATEVASDVDMAMGVAKPGHPVWFVLQHWTWPHVRFPTIAEQTVMAYLAVIHGAKGLGWFAYHDWNFNPDKPLAGDCYLPHDLNHPLWPALVEEVRRFHEIEPWLTAGHHRFAVQQGTDGTRLDWCIKRGPDGSHIVIACNPGRHAVNVDLALPELKGAKTMRVLFEDAATVTVGSRITGRYQGHPQPARDELGNVVEQNEKGPAPPAIEWRVEGRIRDRLAPMTVRVYLVN